MEESAQNKIKQLSLVFPGKVPHSVGSAENLGGNTLFQFNLICVH